MNPDALTSAASSIVIWPRTGPLRAHMALVRLTRMVIRSTPGGSIRPGRGTIGSTAAPGDCGGNRPAVQRRAPSLRTGRASVAARAARDAIASDRASVAARARLLASSALGSSLPRATIDHTSHFTLQLRIVPGCLERRPGVSNAGSPEAR